MVTGMFVAEFARTNDGGKLDVLGGVLDNMTTDAVATGQAVPVPIVVLLQAGPDDDQRAVELTVDVRDPAGEVVGTAQVTYQLPAGTENGFVWLTLPAVFPVVAQHPSAGRYSFHARASGTDRGAAIGLRIVPANRDQIP